MSHRTHIPRARLLRALAALALAGCADAPTAATPAGRAPATPAAPATALELTAMRATVDVETGTMTLEPIANAPLATASPALNGAVRGAIYGNQHVMTRVYNSGVTISAPALGKKTYTANVGVRNLRPHRVGDEQGGLLPADTIGIYVFVYSSPVVTRTSSACTVACTVTVKNAHGQLAFTAAAQSYWHWNEILAAAGLPGDTTRTRKAWVFEADTQVTNFTFDVMVSAGWPAPDEMRWKVDYQGDSLPDTQSEPRWRILRVGTTGTYSAAAGVLLLQPANSTEIGFYRRDSVGVNQNAYIEARIMWDGSANNNPTLAEPRIVLDDGVKYVALGVFRESAGLITSAGTLLGTPTAVVRGSWNVYQLRKYAADSVVYFVNGVRRGVQPYSAFSATPYGATARRVQFTATNARNGDTSIDYFVYELGAVQP